ncbi:hypothetical protein [Streptomyces fulvorobeus]|uniref:Uncharacterized protein n=1 Tax=Streptomyces fulvorobeus TaxID=284028 RepID=A0A7J0BZD1_9ACTN|nr:hypothetical protein [Streptomyces fulvorobeus]NYE39391.1 hypothetical protein [Streptomyces fulvorobeus]GFM95619.1 hypothetical protein Sfulv_04300 [Streptomyces fulvorobeus]
MQRLVHRRADGPPAGLTAPGAPVDAVPGARHTRRTRLLRFGSVIVVLIVMVLVSRAQDTGGSPTASGRSAGDGATALQAARSAAQTHLGLLSGGDWSAAWNGWSGDARRQVPRDTYVGTHRICHPLLAVPLEVERAASVDRRTVEIHWRGGGVTGTLLMVSEDGAWRVAPTTADVRPYAKGAAAAVAELRRRGECTMR